MDAEDAHAGEDAPVRSKSEVKREHLARQALGERLVGLTAGQLAAVPMDEPLRRAVEEARHLRRGAFRRQIRYIARLLGEEDEPAVRAAVEGLDRGHAVDVARARRLERWRERLIEEGDSALGELLSEHPSADRQHLRRAIRAARAERDAGRPVGAARALYRSLRDLADAAGGDPD